MEKLARISMRIVWIAHTLIIFTLPGNISFPKMIVLLLAENCDATIHIFVPSEHILKAIIRQTAFKPITASVTNITRNTINLPSWHNEVDRLPRNGSSSGSEKCAVTFFKLHQKRRLSPP